MLYHTWVTQNFWLSYWQSKEACSIMHQVDDSD
jgi:hypothetical protein